jgi:hypothetical protein
MNISEITGVLESTVQNGQLTVAPNLVSIISLAEVLRFFKTETLLFEEAAVVRIDNYVAVSGKTTLLGVRMGLTLNFTEESDGICASVNALASSVPLLGASWLQISDALFALKISADGTLTGTLGGNVTLNNQTLLAAMTITEVENCFVLDWTISQIQFSTIASCFLSGVALPKDLPDFSFTELKFSLFSNNTYSLAASGVNVGTFPASSQNGLQIAQANLKVEGNIGNEDGSNQFNAAISLQSQQAFELTPELKVKELDLNFKLSQDDWAPSGQLKVCLFEQDFSLEASYLQTQTAQTLCFSAQIPALQNLITIGQSSVGIRSLSLSITESTEDSDDESEDNNETLSESKALSGDTKRTWSIAANGSMNIENLTSLEGQLKLFYSSEKYGLVFKHTKGAVTLPLLPNNQGLVSISLDEISIVRQSKEDEPDDEGNSADDTETTSDSKKKPAKSKSSKSNKKKSAKSSTNNENKEDKKDKEDKEDKEWVFEASAKAAFKDWDSALQTIFSQEVEAKLTAKSDSVKLSVDRLCNPIDIPLGSIQDSNGNNLPPSQMRLDAGQFTIDLSKKELKASAMLGVGLPLAFNQMFGANDDGTPIYNVFNVFDPGAPENSENLIQLELSINEDGEIWVLPRTSPFKLVQLVKDGDDTWINVDLDKFGGFRFKVPKFSYSIAETKFTAKGGIEVTKPLALPLTPLKSLLAETDFKAVSNRLPDTLPLKELNLIDEQGNLRVEGLIAEIEGTIGLIPDEIKSSIKILKEHFELLPAQFRQYLNIQLPQSFHFDIEISSATSDVKFNVHVKDGDPPVRALIPNIPAIQGIELRSFSLGAIFGGNLLTMEVDATFDQFDLPTLAVAALAPQVSQVTGVNTKALQSRLHLNKVFSVIIHQTRIPIILPIFYDNISIEYLDIAGVELMTEVKFPMPKLNLVEIAKLFYNLIRFCTDKQYLLDPYTPPKDFNLRFALPLTRNYLQLPQYLGGGRLGSTKAGIDVNAYQLVAILMNAIKTGSINRLIQAMPIEYRIGQTQVKFGQIQFDTGWLVTTPGEFRAIAAQTSEQLVSPVLQLTPVSKDGLVSFVSTNNTQEEGLITLLRGATNINNVMRLEAIFGVAFSSSIGFQTAFQMDGAIANFAFIHLSGKISVAGTSQIQQDPNTPIIQVIGTSSIVLNQVPIFTGDLRLINDEYTSNGNLNLWGIQANCSMLINSTKMLVQGTMAPIRLVNDTFVLTGANGQSSPSIFMQWNSYQTPTLLVSGALTLLGSTTVVEINQSQYEFYFEVSQYIFGLFMAQLQLNGHSLTEPNTIRVRGTMQNDFLQYIRTGLSRIIEGETNAAIQKLDVARQTLCAAQNEVNRLDSLINTQYEIIRGERAVVESQFQAANQRLNEAQQKVNSLWNQINQISSERDRLLQEAKIYWYNPAVTVPNMAQVSFKQTELAGLYTALGGATAGLEIAKAAVNACSQTMNWTPIEVDPRISGLYALRETATINLTIAEKVLETTQLGVGAFGTVSNYVIQYGSDGLINVKSASFQTSLNELATGNTNLSIQLGFMGQTLDLNLLFNFYNPTESIMALRNILLTTV